MGNFNNLCFCGRDIIAFFGQFGSPEIFSPPEQFAGFAIVGPAGTGGVVSPAGASVCEGQWTGGVFSCEDCDLTAAACERGGCENS